MKILINQNAAISELEVVINCPAIDRRVQSMVDYIRQCSDSLPGSADDISAQIPLNTVLYIERIDRKTFFYDRQRVFRCEASLAALEAKLENCLFTRISKNCIVNIAQIASFYKCGNHKLGLILKNGERLVAGRTYAQTLRAKTRQFSAELTYQDCFSENEPAGGTYCSFLNHNRILRFYESPRRIVAISYYAAELLCALGIEDRIAGIASAGNEIQYLLPEYQERLHGVPVIQYADRCVPLGTDLERLRPDFIIANFYYQNYLQRSGDWSATMPLYIFEGSIPGKNTMESVYRDLFHLGKLFGQEARAVALAERLRESIVRLPIKPLKKAPPKVFVYDSSKATPITACADTLETHLIALAGGKNIFARQRGTYQAVTWDAVAELNPDYIIVHEYHDYLSAEEKINWLKGLPALRHCTAVRNDHFIVMTLAEVFPGVQNAFAVEKLFSAFYPECL